jgi:hypothetical protein
MQDKSMSFLDTRTMWSLTSSTRWKVDAEMKLSVHGAQSGQGCQGAIYAAIS